MRKSLFRNTSGAAAVEFAFVLPILLLLFAGIAQFGWSFYLHTSIHNASSNVTRRIAVGELDSTDTILITQQLIQTLGINLLNPTVSITEVEKQITVSVSVPKINYALIDIFGLFTTGNLVTNIVMRRE